MAITAPPAAEDRHPEHRRSGADRARGHHDLRRREGRRHRHPGPVPRRALRPRRRMPHVRRGRGRARVCRRLRSPLRGRHGGEDDHARGRAAPRHAHPAPDGGPAAHRGGPEGDDHRRQRAARARPPLRNRAGGRHPAGRGPRDRPEQSGHRRQPRRVHPVRPLRPRLRRHPGQRRDRPLRQGLLHADRVRPERPDGRVVLRHVRRVRGGLPDGRARQQADQRTCRSSRAPSSTQSTPSARTAASAARSPTTWTASGTDLVRRRARAAGLEEAACA